MRSKLHQPITLAGEVWGGKSRTTADFQRVWRLDGQRPPTLAGLQRTDAGANHWP